MESYEDRSRLDPKTRSPTVRWVKEWVPQDVVATGGKCYLLKWVTEDKWNALREKTKELELQERKPKPATEMFFLCTYDGCGKTFTDAGALRKHTHIHGERQYVCPVEGCGKKFLDSSKLKRHNLIHTGEKSHYCPYEGCGKDAMVDMRPQEKPSNAAKAPVLNSASSDRPYVCPFAGCEKAYIHEYKLNLHLRKEHPGHNPEEGYKTAPMTAGEHWYGELNDQDALLNNKYSKRGKASLSRKLPPAKVAKQRVSSPNPVVSNDAQKRRQNKELDEDSEETEEDQEEEDEEEENGWRYLEANRDDEETEDED
ncbi:zinc finger transcription factor YY1 isoform X2 [Dendrobium catenatum]|uniref:zinc finger transcription factor YY1 isoform X2 n=1 Tax=Dendrobium catenatum TaxID=906689 RepID=UPI0009F3C754|nr:zinc finger transcription factor YY1 isoform X2 [Dendrobium catenatum]